MPDTPVLEPGADDRLQDPRSLPYSHPRWRGDLPHLHKEGCTYFVTFCLRDAIPVRARRRLLGDREETFQAVVRRAEPPGARRSGLLAQARVAELVEAALLHFHGSRYVLHAWTVMPDHVHVVVTPLAGHSLSDVLHSWKSYSAHGVNRELRRSGPLWESESFDHLVRGEEQLGRFLDYVENNPVAAGLCATPEEWPFGSASKRR